MKTLIEMFTQDRIWRRQLKEVETLRSKFIKVREFAHVIDDRETELWLGQARADICQRLRRAIANLKWTEHRILATYNKLVTYYCDYSAHYDDEYFIEKIDLDGYLRGTIL